MNKEFFEALECLAHENSIPLEALVEKIQQGSRRPGGIGEDGGFR